jgi:hypothetical protein
MTAPAIVVTEFKPLVKGTLRGFAEVHLPSGMKLHDVQILETNGRWWAGAPSKPQLNRDGVALRDTAGKIKYQPVVSFASKAIRDRFSDSVIAALWLAYPEVVP